MHDPENNFVMADHLLTYLSKSPIWQLQYLHASKLNSRMHKSHLHVNYKPLQE